MKSSTRDWLQAATDDLRVIARIDGDEHLTNMTAFHAQQCVEKCMKAVMEEKEIGVRRVHNLHKLFELCSPWLSLLDEDKDTVILLDKLYTDARYPGEAGLLPYGKPTTKQADIFLVFAKRIFDICSGVVSDNSKPTLTGSFSF